MKKLCLEEDVIRDFRRFGSYPTQAVSSITRDSIGPSFYIARSE
jgi:hypothetical protein